MRDEAWCLPHTLRSLGLPERRPAQGQKIPDGPGQSGGRAKRQARGPLKEFPGLQGCNFDHVRPLEDLDREMTGTHFAIAADTRTTLCGLPPPHLRTGARVLTTAGRLHL